MTKRLLPLLLSLPIVLAGCMPAGVEQGGAPETAPAEGLQQQPDSPRMDKPEDPASEEAGDTEYMREAGGEDRYPGYDRYKPLAAQLVAERRELDTVPAVYVEDVQTGAAPDGSELTAVLYRVHTFDFVLVADVGGAAHAVYVTDYGMGGNVHLADLDGDGADEIYVQVGTTANGGSGVRVHVLYRAGADGLEELFRPLHEWDDGFRVIPYGDERITITNLYTGYRAEIPDAGAYPQHVSGWDTDAESPATDVWGNYFFNGFYDIDGDGTVELNVSHYCFWGSRINGIGTAYYFLKWDAQAGTMRVVKTAFRPFTATPAEGFDSFYDEARYVEQHWFLD